MPWQNNGGSGNRGPWGQGSGGGNEPPNIEDLIRKGQDKFRGAFGGNAGGGKGILLIVLAVLLLWLATGIFKVQSGEEGVVQRFGAWSATKGEGLHYHWPYPVETVTVIDILKENQIDVGFRGTGDMTGLNPRSNTGKERQMLTGDENIIDAEFTIFWDIKDSKNYLFNIGMKQQTIKSVAESVVREIIANTPIQKALTSGRGIIETDARINIQKVLDGYSSGVSIKRVNLIKVDPPSQVFDAFRDVQKAEADRERTVNLAEAYRNDLVPKARGSAAQMVQQAEAYKASVIATSEGEAARFLSVYNEYVQAKDVTRRRMYLETMERIMGDLDKIVIDGKAGSGVVPYLALPELKKRSGN